MIDDSAFTKAWLEHQFEVTNYCYAGDVRKIIEAYLAAMPQQQEVDWQTLTTLSGQASCVLALIDDWRERGMVYYTNGTPADIEIERLRTSLKLDSTKAPEGGAE